MRITLNINQIMEVLASIKKEADDSSPVPFVVPDTWLPINDHTGCRKLSQKYEIEACLDYTGTTAFYDPSKGRIVFVSVERNEVIGRAVDAGVAPKWYKYHTSSIGFKFLNARATLVKETIVIVEDVFSAIKVWQHGHHSIALLGTTISDKLLYSIVKDYKYVILMLDPYAEKTTLKLQKLLSPYVWTKMVFLPADPKDVRNRVLQDNLEVATKIVHKRPAQDSAFSTLGRDIIREEIRRNGEKIIQAPAKEGMFPVI